MNSGPQLPRNGITTPVDQCLTVYSQKRALRSGAQWGEVPHSRHPRARPRVRDGEARAHLNLILVRHGETDANCERQTDGRQRGPISEHDGQSPGRQHRGGILRPELPFHLYASPAQRAQETASVISEALNIPFVEVDASDRD